MTMSLAARTRVTGGMLACAAALLWCHAASPSAQAGGPVQWMNLVNATAAGNSIQKAGGCAGCPDAGGTSHVAIASGDGYVEFTPRAGGRLYAGLGTTASGSTDTALIDYAFSFWPDGGWDVRERNVYKTEGRFVAGDVFRVALVGGHIEYSRNGAVVYTSLVPPPLPLLLDTTLISADAGLDAAVIYGQELSALPVPLTIGTTSLPDGPMLQPYSAPLQAAGGSGTFTWTITGGALPAGLSLAPAGTISGVPQAKGVSSFTVRATDAVVGNYVEQSLTLRIFVVYALTISPATLSPSRIGVAYSATLNATGGSGVYSWSVVEGSLPGGVFFDAVSANIHGTPTTGGRFDVTVRAVDASDPTKLGEQTLTLSTLAAAPPSTYDAIVDRAPRPKGAVPVLAGAGFTFSDPIFGTSMLRVTDGNLRPIAPNRSYRTPSGTHTNAWSADGRLFYTVSTDGTVVPFAFDPETMRASRFQPSAEGDGGLTLRFFNEPTFSYITPGVAYGTYNGAGSNLHSVDQYDFYSGEYSQLLNLETLAGGLAGTYTGGLGNSAGAAERLFAFFGGTSQDRHFYLVVFDKMNPSNRLLLDTVASTVDGQPTNIPLNFKIHAAAIDRSGRYVTIYPTGGDRQPPRSAAPGYVWDTLANTFTATPLVQAISGGHDAYGFGYRVNQDSGTASWDAAQWQLRSLATPLTTFSLIRPVLRPEEEFLADHPSWHNAQPDRLVPFLDANYRYGANTTVWRAWDEELFAVQTDGAGGGATVWRFAHHRSLAADDVDPSRISFWYTPRANVSPDGRWALFTSNWDKTLGIDPGEAVRTYRQDVFMVELTRSLVHAPPVAIGTTALPSGTVSQPYSFTLQASGGSGSFAWSVVSGALPAGLTLNTTTGVVAGTPVAGGLSKFIVRVTDAANATNRDDQSLTITVAPLPVAPVVITTTSVPDAVLSTAYSAQLAVAGGRTPLTWSKVSGTLPPGLTLNAATGKIAGTPSRTGNWSFTVRVVDSAVPSTSDTQALSIEVRRRR